MTSLVLFMKEIIAMGAEATLFREGAFLFKSRVPKTYRHQDIDDRLRKSRTKKEIKGLLKAKELGIPVPELYPHEDPYTIHMEYILGKRLRDVVREDSAATLAFFQTVGGYLARLHSVGLIHGDLTTSNILIKDDASTLYLIDFGLSYFSEKIEDMAVDIHVFEEALESTHYVYALVYFDSFLKGYKEQQVDYDNIIKRLEVVQSRGRNKK